MTASFLAGSLDYAGSEAGKLCLTPPQNVPRCRKLLQPHVLAGGLAYKQARRVCSRFGERRQKEAPELHTRHLSKRGISALKQRSRFCTAHSLCNSHPINKFLPPSQAPQSNLRRVMRSFVIILQCNFGIATRGVSSVFPLLFQKRRLRATELTYVACPILTKLPSLTAVLQDISLHIKFKDDMCTASTSQKRCFREEVSSLYE